MILLQNVSTLIANGLIMQPGYSLAHVIIDNGKNPNMPRSEYSTDSVELTLLSCATCRLHILSATAPHHHLLRSLQCY